MELSAQPKNTIRASRFGRLLAAVFLGALFAPVPRSDASLTFYSSRAAFDLTNPGLSTETFEGGNIAPGTFAYFTGPLNSSTANALFSPGSILPGVSIFDLPGPDPGDMVYVGEGTQPGVSKAILSRNFFDDSLDLNFSVNVSAVGFDYCATIGPGRINYGSFIMSVYGSSGLLGSLFISTPEGSTVFFGVSSSTDRITRVNVDDKSYHSELIDNLSFGMPAVPEPAETTLIAAALTVAVLRSSRSSRA
jgi:hypothetical protein